MKMSCSCSLFALHCLVLLQFCTHRAMGWGPTDPTDGFVSLPLNSSSFLILKPYDLLVSDRYSFIDGVHRLWVFATDKPHALTSITAPRTEIRVPGNYSSGVWQFEGYGFVPNGTSGVCIMQIHGASTHATTAMVRVYNGSLTYYQSPVLVPYIYDRWFRLNVIHDVGRKKVSIFIDGVLKLTVDDHGAASHNFHCGVYAQNDRSYYMESRWKDIRVLKKM
ncbi:citrate-binding protein-like isoform X1 [Magnolia sinica]|uniref:citrate-binding protein-like isoform X1 n=1 Tax=Magnolia sinica TaxID=86752 RepID=UPI0026597257|nr:citrate-binding protein-like isoform X1 [Magnolia sinica]